MKFNQYFLAACTLFILSSCYKNEDVNSNTSTLLENVLKPKANQTPAPVGEVFSQLKTDEIILQTLSERKDFRWEWMDLKTIWSAAHYGNQAVALGYKPADLKDVTSSIHSINLKSAPWKTVHDALIELILSEINKTALSPIKIEDILIEDDQILPIITIRLTDKNTFTALYNLENVRYIEPLDYWPQSKERSTSGCSASTISLNTSDWTTISPNCRLPWNYNNVNIPNAWNVTQGQGITIGVIDAGISNAQFFLSSLFNSGSSNVGRTLSTDYTYGTTAFTTCTHGTSMSGLAAGPRNSGDATTGVAYKSNLHFIRACEDVVLDGSSEKTGVKNALVKMGDKTDVRIVSMSIGTPFSSSILEDGVNYANNKGKMVFAAAGTSFSWTSWCGVIYPASYSACIAVTGVKENGSTCASCHDGSEVDFTIPMERSSNTDRNSLSLPAAGSTPTYIGGSSCATATSAGIAALVWSAKPSLTKTQVYLALRNSSQFYPSYSGSLGYGNLNAAAAVNLALTY
jgi:hypothetical protein